jgi:uncharacterized membrane protein HdeD (DUF308 family)
MDGNAQHRMYYTLRVAMAMCFIGHGAFGIITKPVWCNYFAVFGIDNQLAYRLMPPLGAIDIILGLIVLFHPVRAVVLWLMVWGTATALLRPLSGEPFAEFIERAGNYGAPLAMLLLAGVGRNNWFTPLTPAVGFNERRVRNVKLCLKIIVFLLLAGHGWLNMAGKKGLIDLYSSLGFAEPARLAITVGAIEVLAAVAVLVRPVSGLLAILLVWKMCSELFYPHYTVFEWVERGGSYGTILALYFATAKIRGTFFRLPKITFPLPGR